ncbi:uncharacterized protein LOC110067501 isoform X3 [Orbicella faveolata]|nr:uncharacterized protein LOC110067501 isoform X3 [Orbicella faveolata]
MEQGRQIVSLVLLAVVSALLSVSETRSIASMEQHNIKKRSLYEETCPPPYIIEVTEQCNDSCFDDDYCVGNQMCCFDGCSYVCMDPVPSVPVIDWIDQDETISEIRAEQLEVVTPIVEELGCYYHGMTLSDGERIPLGCKLCSCFNGNLMCDVSNCNKEYQARLALERSGSGSGDDEDDDDDDGVKGEGSGDDNWYQLEGVKSKQDFIPFEELHKKENSGVEMKEGFIPFDADHSGIEQSGEEDNKHHAVDRGENFISFDADHSGMEQSGEEGDKHNVEDRGKNYIPFDEETDNAQSGDNAAYFARRRL